MNRWGDQIEVLLDLGEWEKAKEMIRALEADYEELKKNFTAAMRINANLLRDIRKYVRDLQDQATQFATLNRDQEHISPWCQCRECMERKSGAH